MFRKHDDLVDALIEKNLAKPIAGMEKPDLTTAAGLVGRDHTDSGPDDVSSEYLDAKTDHDAGHK